MYVTHVWDSRTPFSSSQGFYIANYYAMVWLRTVVGWTPMCTHTHTQTNTHANTRIHTLALTHRFIHTDTHARTHKQTHGHRYAYAHKHTHTHTLTHSHTYIHTQSSYIPRRASASLPHVSEGGAVGRCRGGWVSGTALWPSLFSWGGHSRPRKAVQRLKGPEGYSIKQAKHKARLISLSLATFSQSSVPLTWLKGSNHGNLSDQTNVVGSRLTVRLTWAVFQRSPSVRNKCTIRRFRHA